MRLYSVLVGLSVAPVVLSELIQIQVVARAGARKFIPVGEPRLEIGAPLLPEGYATMEALGKLLRSRYLVPGADVPLANATGTYKAGDAYIRSISRDQAASSANAFAYGLYPPVQSAFPDAKVKPLSNGQQDVPVFTLSRGMDNLLSAYAVCPKLEENIAQYFNSTAFRNKAAETAAVRTYVAQNYNMSSELFYMPFVYDRALVNRKFHDEAARGRFPINETVFAKLKDMADFVEMGKFRHDVSGSLCGGPLLGQIFERMTLAMYGDKSRSNPVLSYVGTHPTLACLVGAMNLSDSLLTNHMVPYGSALVFELHRIGSGHFVQLLYHEGGANSTTFRTVPLGHKGGPCEDDSTLCAVEDARSLFRDSMTPSTIDWCDSCEAYFLPVCNQAAQIKLAEIISVGEQNTKTAKRKGTINTVGAGFLGVMSGVLFALLCVYGVPAIRSKLANRRGRNYSPADDEGIETPERGGEAI